MNLRIAFDVHVCTLCKEQIHKDHHEIAVGPTTLYHPDCYKKVLIKRATNAMAELKVLELVSSQAEHL